MKLTDVKIRNAKPGLKPIKLTDGKGLYLEVKPSGSKLWRYRYRIDGKENVFAIGVYPEDSLADARTALTAARKLVKQGVHPAHHRKTEKRVRETANRNTFQHVAQDWIDSKKKNWTPRYLNQVERFMDLDIYPHIGNLPIKSVTAADILDIIKRAETRGAENVAILERQWCSAVFRFGVATLRADSDPAAALRGAITRPPVKHHEPLTRHEIPGFLAALEVHGGYQATRIALKLLMLTFVRPGELRGARWSEFDLEAAEWRIPAERMKMRKPHIVPLSTQAVALLYELQDITGRQQWLFPNYRRPKDHMNITTLNRSIERMGYKGMFSAHGFRATASTILNESGYRPDVIERQLAHAEKNAVRASYNQAQYLPERRDMMQQWADYIDALKTDAGKVVPLKAKQAG